jgi:hypothetical protein
MSPSLRNLFMKLLTRDRVVPIISKDIELWRNSRMIVKFGRKTEPVRQTEAASVVLYPVRLPVMPKMCSVSADL